MERLSDFSKQAIFNCYGIMKECVDSEHIEDGEFICSSLKKFHGIKIAMPVEVYEKIDKFITNVIHPIVDDPDFFKSLHTPEIGEYDSDGKRFVINSEKALYTLLGRFFTMTNMLEQEVDSFAEKELQPYLL